jgi:Bacterial SH3 domain
MRKIILGLILCCSCLAINAQENAENSVYSSISKWEVGDAFTLVSDANIREKPTTQSTAVTQLPIGSAIKIEKVTEDSFTVNGFRAPWCQISYDGGKKKGYLWGGFIATLVLKSQYGFGDTEGLTFLGGVGSWNEQKHQMTMQLRTCLKNKELAKVEFLTSGDLSFNCQLKEENAGTLKNVFTALTFSTGYEACGYPWGDNLIFYTKDKKLSRILATESISDAGVFYSTEQYILPGDRGGITNYVIVTSDAAEMQDNGKDYVIKNQKYSLKLFKWTGVKLEKVK